MTADPAGGDAALGRAVRDETAGVVRTLARRLGDLDVAEEAVAEAVAEALVAWRRDGVPDRPGAWLHTAARRNALDLLRRGQARARLADRLRDPAPDAPAATDDERVGLLFACCHPALGPEARLALTGRAVLGLSTAQLARAFVVPETTAAQRIVRAKRKITANAVALEVPDDPHRATRLHDVLTVLQVLFTEGWLATSGPAADDRDLADDARWLAGGVATRLPEEPEAWGLLALLTLQAARTDARFGADGSLVLLEHQDRSRWDAAMIAQGMDQLARAAVLRRSGPFQLRAAIAACHAEAPTWSQTDWPQILALYDALAVVDPTAVTHLNRAVAVGQVHGPDAALADVDRLAGDLARYHLFHAVRADLLRRLGHAEDARRADAEALVLAANPAERRLLEERLSQ